MLKALVLLASLCFTTPDLSVSGIDVSENITIQVNNIDTSTINHIDLKVNNTLIWIWRKGDTLEYVYDTRRSQNGQLVFEAIMVDDNGATSFLKTQNFNINNQVYVFKDPIPNPKRPWIKRSVTMGSTDIENYDPQYLDFVKTSGDNVTKNLFDNFPNLPQSRYTNVSNIYLNYLLDWNKYADLNNIDRERMFFHVSKVRTSNRAIGGSTRVSSLFWNALLYNGTTVKKCLSSISNASVGDVPLSNVVNNNLVIGYPEKFREIHINYSRIGSDGWSGVWEYFNGNDWVALPLLTDGADVVFDPPADWKATGLPGDASLSSDDDIAYLYYVRLRTTNPGIAPIITMVTGRNWTGRDPITGKGTETIYPFDYNSDVNKDGYLNDEEWMTRKEGYNARFMYESRLLTGYGDWRFVSHIHDALVRDWYVEKIASDTEKDQYRKWVFFDNGFPDRDDSVIEYGVMNPFLYIIDIGTLYSRIVADPRIKFGYANMAGLPAKYIPIVMKVFPSVHNEAFVQAIGFSYSSLRTAIVRINSLSDNGAIFATFDIEDGDRSLEWTDVVVQADCNTIIGKTSLTNKTYIGSYLRLNNQTPRLITAYDRATRKFTVDTPFDKVPAIGDQFLVSGEKPDGSIMIGKTSEGVYTSDHALLIGSLGGRGYQDRRMRMLAASIYYIFKRDFFVFSPFSDTAQKSGFEGAIPETNYDIGVPLGDYSEFKPAEDPNGTKYRMFMRRYSNALVILRPRITSTDISDNSSSIRFTLDGNYRLLLPDVLGPTGYKLGEVQNFVDLRNMDAAILIPVVESIPATEPEPGVDPDPSLSPL
jgi:hypothetical protein